MLQNLINAVKHAAPAFAGALASPAANIAISLLANAFGVTGDVDTLALAITSDPVARAKLLMLENEHAEALAKLASADYATEVDDRKSARLREISLHDHVPFILACAFLVIYALVQFTAVFYPAPSEDIISARVQDIMVMIVSYFFGSTNRKGRKDNL